MCSIVILSRPDHAWPLIIAANRDEIIDREWDPPARHWRHEPGIIAGRDRAGGGSWLGLNDRGLFAAILNRVGSLGPKTGFTSRGALVIDMLRHPTSAAAIAALQCNQFSGFRSFNMVIADKEAVFWIRHRDDSAATVDILPVPPGISMITAHDRNNPASLRIRHFLPRFESATPPDPAAGLPGWQDWQDLMLSHEVPPGGGPYDAMYIMPRAGFGTVCTSFVAIPRVPAPDAWHGWFARAGEDFHVISPKVL